MWSTYHFAFSLPIVLSAVAVLARAVLDHLVGDDARDRRDDEHSAHYESGYLLAVEQLVVAEARLEQIAVYEVEQHIHAHEHDEEYHRDREDRTQTLHRVRKRRPAHLFEFAERGDEEIGLFGTLLLRVLIGLFLEFQLFLN